MNANPEAPGGFAAPIGSPIRVRLSRKKGWRMPPNTVVVSRPSKWGNPYRVGSMSTTGMPLTADQAVDEFKRYAVALDCTDLRGKNLACWCALDVPCHADVLLRLANDQDQAQPPTATPERKGYEQ